MSVDRDALRQFREAVDLGEVIQDLEAVQADLEAGVRALNAEWDERKAEVAKLDHEMAKLTVRYQAVADVVAIMEDHITHVVWRSGWGAVPKIMTWVEALQSQESVRDRYMVGLVLNDRGTGVVWKRNQYHDGSGRWTGLALCRSEAEARKIVADLFDQDVAEWRANRKKGKELHVRLWDGYASMGMEFPPDLVESLNVHTDMARAAAIMKAAEALADAEALPTRWELP